MKEDTRE